MGLQSFLNVHFNPWESTKQIPENSTHSNLTGIAGLTCIGVAGLGLAFFGGSQATSLMIGGAGVAFLASYCTEKDGYVYLVAAAILGGLIYATIGAVIDGRVIVKVNVGDIIRACHDIYSKASTQSS